MMTFITKQGGSRFYLQDTGRADDSFIPPGHADKLFCILEERNGSDAEQHRLSNMVDADWMPQSVRDVARKTVAEHPGDTQDENWQRVIYAHFAHCYSRDGSDRSASNCAVYGKFWGNAEQERDENARHHLGYLYIRAHYDATHEPRIDLMGNYAPGVGA